MQQYLLFHYGSEDEQMPWEFGPKDGLNFPQRCLERGLLPDLIPSSGARALDLGCAVGRLSFELARYCGQVIGIDFSHSFIETARTLCREGGLPFQYVECGRIMRQAVARVPDVDCSRVSFEQGDAQQLRLDLGQFDVVVMANLLCRLPQPRVLLQRLPDLVKPGGQLILASPQSWLESYTSPEHWIGGLSEEASTLDVLKQLLSSAFEVHHSAELPFVIREHARKYQWSVAQLSTWLRRKDEP